jgi:hypothetical protein
MFYFLFLIVLPLISPVSSNEGRIEKAVQTELAHYPEARLRDIYKNFFQDAFGPGHLIPDTAHAGKYLNYELKKPVWTDTLKWQAIGPENDYYRINLDLVRKGVLPRGVLLEAMVESAPLARNPDIETWKREWENAIEVIEKMNLKIPDFEADKKAIEEMLTKGEFVMHHSDHYDKTYNRHYRIVHRSVFERWSTTYLK